MDNWYYIQKMRLGFSGIDNDMEVTYIQKMLREWGVKSWRGIE